jgi:hypothetical protein
LVDVMLTLLQISRLAFCRHDKRSTMVGVSKEEVSLCRLLSIIPTLR